MILWEGRQAVITFIDYTFDTESQMFLDEAFAEAGVSAKVCRIVQVIFAAANGVMRLGHPDGTMTLSEPFDIARGVLQGARGVLQGRVLARIEEFSIYQSLFLFLLLPKRKPSYIFGVSATINAI